MTTAVSSSRKPRWQEEAESVDLVPSRMLSLTEVADRTGLKTSTVMTAVHSTAHGRRSRLHSLSRPRYNVDGVPYWAPEQAADYLNAQERMKQEWSGLPVVDSATAVERQVTSLHGLNRVSGVPIGTLHRWKNASGFPEPVALMAVGSSSPRRLYSWPEVRTYIRENRQRWLAKHPEVDLKRRVTDTTV